MVEQLICNQQVKGSSPFVSSLPKSKRNQQTPRQRNAGSVVRGSFEGEGAVGCPSGQREQTVNLPRLALRRFESFPHHFVARGRSSVGRASAFQAEGRGFEPRRPLCTKNARVAQSVERVLGKDEVTGSIPVASSGNDDVLLKRTLTKESQSNGQGKIRTHQTACERRHDRPRGPRQDDADGGADEGLGR